MRWARILRRLGHRVRVANDDDGRPADLMLALNAWRSAEAIRSYRERCPDGPLIVALGGTDVYEFLRTDPAPTLRSLELADRLVALHDLAHRALPRRFRSKLRVIFQSAPPLLRKGPSRDDFTVLVIGHLRDVKDPLRTALAARRLPASSLVRVVHLGAAHTPDWARRARAEMERNPRYRWLGDVTPSVVRRWLGRADLMALTSRLEGGANVISEAAAAGVPIVASRIDGTVGLLGPDYPGYFKVGDTPALARLLRRAESDANFIRALTRAMRRRATRFTPAREVLAWRSALAELRRS